MSDTVKIGFVGVGGMGQCAHLKNYVTIPGCEVVAIAEPRARLAEMVARKYNIPRVYPDGDAMIAGEKQLDGLVASQPFTRHGVLLPGLYKSGIPVFTEKPLSGNLQIGEQLVQTLASTGNWHMVGYHKRSDPATMYAKAEIDRLKASGELGALKYIRILMPAGDWVANGFTDLLMTDEPYPACEWEPPAADMDKPTYELYNAFVNYYIHQVNMMQHLLGETYTVTYADPTQVMLAVQSASGVTGVIEMTPYQSTIDWNEHMFVAFEHGYVYVELPAPLACNRAGRVTIFRDPGNGVTPMTETPTMPWVHAMRQQAINFCDAIRGVRAPMCTAAEALEDLRVARQYIRLLKGV